MHRPPPAFALLPFIPNANNFEHAMNPSPPSRLPPLNALRAFEVAARHRSLSRAAKELNVTQAAVSSQVKLLEQRLGMRLFHRHSSGLKPTAQAEEYFSAVRQAFQLMNEATETLLHSAPTTHLTVSCMPNIAMRWLLPRLHSFHRLYPHFEVNVLTSTRSDDFDQEQMDVAIRWGNRWPKLESHYLFSAEMVPVCSPALVQGSKALKKPSDLAHATLLHVQGTMEDWGLWLDHAKVNNVDPLHGPRFDSLTFALQAAAEGLGVAVGRLPLMEDDLKLGRLVAPFSARYFAPKAWHLVYPNSMAYAAKVKAFTQWVLEEARQSPYHMVRKSE